jgi:hypothetical protein
MAGNVQAVQKLVLTIPHAVGMQEYADELLDWLKEEAKRLETDLGNKKLGYVPVE